MLKDFEFRLRTRTLKESSEGILIDYLNSKDTLYPSKDMAMIALISYWLPFAYIWGGASKENLQAQIRSCIYRLELHLQYLQDMLGEETALCSRTQIQEKLPIEMRSTSILTREKENIEVSNHIEKLCSLEKMGFPQDPDDEQWHNPFKKPHS